jgi:glycerol-3-phosphate dehydrogenase
VDLTTDDVVGTYAGLRPLVGEASGSGTVKVSREHKVTVEGSGLVRIGGGKYTTYRVMAGDAVDAALGPDEAKRRPSATADLPVVGAASRSVLDGLAHRLALDTGLEEAQATRLVARHGTEALGVVELGRALDLLRPLVSDRPFLEAEVPWAARHEMALSLDDVLSRRFRLSMELRDRGEAVAPRVAELLGAELGWDADRQASEVERYLAGARAEYGVARAGDEANPAAAPAAHPGAAAAPAAPAAPAG